MKRRGDTGSGSILLLALVALLTTVGIGALLLGAAINIRRGAQSAADLSALAAAGSILDGQSTACSRAADVAERNGATLMGCRLLDEVVEVQVAIEPRSRLLPNQINGVARAGKA